MKSSSTTAGASLAFGFFLLRWAPKAPPMKTRNGAQYHIIIMVQNPFLNEKHPANWQRMASLVRDTAFSFFSAHGPPAGIGSRNGLSFQKSLKRSYPLYLTLGRYLVEAYHRRSLGNREDDPPTKVEWSQFTATTYYYLCYNSPSQTMVHLQKMVSVVGFRNALEQKTCGRRRSTRPQQKNRWTQSIQPKIPKHTRDSDNNKAHESLRARSAKVGRVGCVLAVDNNSMSTKRAYR